MLMRVMYRAAAAYPFVDRDRATTDLRAQLEVMAAAGGGVLDWATFEVSGPTEQLGMHDWIWFEWAGTVEAAGGRDLTRESLEDDLQSRVSHHAAVIDL